MARSICRPVSPRVFVRLRLNVVDKARVGSRAPLLISMSSLAMSTAKPAMRTAGFSALAASTAASIDSGSGGNSVGRTRSPARSPTTCSERCLGRFEGALGGCERRLGTRQARLRLGQCTQGALAQVELNLGRLQAFFESFDVIAPVVPGYSVAQDVHVGSNGVRHDGLLCVAQIRALVGDLMSGLSQGGEIDATFI